MPSLREAQRAFAGALLERSRERSWGMSVYRGNAIGNWSGALANAYPIVRKIVGVEFFDAMVRAYAFEHPSRSGDLNEYGGHLPDFVAAYPDTQDLPYLPDVARMEWLAHLSHYAPDALPFDAAALAKLRPENYAALRPSLAPGSALMKSHWPLGRIWTVHQDDYMGDPAVDLSTGVDWILLHRPRWRVEVLSIALGDYRLLACASRDEPLGELLEAVLTLDPSFDPSSALARWVHAGVLSL